jgi:3-(3-hydroxy-phenyl)propionate hydroxylase
VRAVYNTRADESDEEALSEKAVRARLCRVHAPDADWVHLNLYNVHQRVAKQFRKGRVFLCGDAAHVNNPIGGLGSTPAFHEAWDLAGVLSEEKRPRRLRAADAGRSTSSTSRSRPWRTRSASRSVGSTS